MTCFLTHDDLIFFEGVWVGMVQGGQGVAGISVGDAVEVQVELVKKDYLVIPPSPQTLNYKP